MNQITTHNQNDLIKMRAAGKLAGQVLDYITDFVRPDITTLELNNLCHQYIIDHGAIPAPLNYRGFPKSICTSINHVVCHGIPDEKKLKHEDILNIDVTIILDGWFGDTSRMFYIGKPSVKAKKLVEITYEAMMLGIEQIKPGLPINVIGTAIENFIKKFGYSSVRDYCGHGIGQIFHSSPNILHYHVKEPGPIMKPGMFFTVEPMINAGSHETKLNKIDGWTVTTRDRSLSAQFEHTIAVTDSGYEILTLSSNNFKFPPYN